MSAEKVFADTNLFLRYLTNDVPAQADAVENLLRRAGQKQVELITTSMVIAEIIWTLESFYNLRREDIQAKVFAILHTPGLQVTDADLVSHAVTWYAAKNVDFIDAYHAAWMLREGIGKACTFDKKHFQRFDGIVVDVPGKA
jgi:predicted nucleic-acid-binding protein